MGKRQAFRDESSDEDAPEEAGIRFPTDGNKKFKKGSHDWGAGQAARGPHGGGEEDQTSGEDANTASSSSDSESDGGDDDIPLGQLMALKQDGSTQGPQARKRTKALRQSQQLSFKRDNKHRPVQMSSRRPVSVLRETLQEGRRQARDPRFDALTAERAVDEGKFKQRYAFLYDEKLPEERKELQEALKKTKGEAKKRELKAALARVTQQVKEEATRRRRDAAEAEERAKRNAVRASGKSPFYLKKSEKKKQELVAKFGELQSSGQLERFMEKRRKKNAAKDHRYLPSRRPAGGE